MTYEQTLANAVRHAVIELRKLRAENAALKESNRQLEDKLAWFRARLRYANRRIYIQRRRAETWKHRLLQEGEKYGRTSQVDVR